MRETPIPVEVISAFKQLQDTTVTDEQIKTWIIQVPCSIKWCTTFNKVSQTTLRNQSLNHTGHIEQSYVVLKAISNGIL